MEELHEELSKRRLTSQEICDSEEELDDLLVFSKTLIADLFWGDTNLIAVQ